MPLRGKNMVFNSSFDLEAAEAEFPMGWVRLNGDEETTVEWSTDHAVIGSHSVKIINRRYLESIAGVVQDERYSIAVESGAVWELAAWMRTEKGGVPLRLLAVFLDTSRRYHSEAHLKFTSTTAMERYSGLVFVPEGAAWLKVACGVHDTPATLPSTLWLSWITAIKLV